VYSKGHFPPPNINSELEADSGTKVERWVAACGYFSTPSNCCLDVSGLHLYIYSLAGDTVLSNHPRKTPESSAVPQLPQLPQLPPGHFQVAKTIPLMLAVCPVNRGIQLCQMTLHMIRLIELHQLLLTCHVMLIPRAVFCVFKTGKKM